MPENNENQSTQNQAEDVGRVFNDTHNPFTAEGVADVEEIVTDENQQQLPGEQQAAATTDVNDDSVVDPVEYLNEQWRASGVKIESLDDVPALIKAAQEAIANKPQGFSPEEIARIKLARETGDWGLYDKIVSVDTKSLSAVDALKAKFMIENSELGYLAEKQFERMMKAKEVAEGDEELEAKLLEIEGNKAKRWLEEKKNSLAVAEDSAEQEGDSELDNQWFEGVDKVVSTIQTDKNIITYFTDDNIEVNVPMSQDEVIALRDAMDKPVEWLKDQIANEDGSWNYEALAHLVLKVEQFDRAFKEAYELGRVHQEDHTLGKQRGSTQTARTGPAINNMDVRQQVGQQFQQFK